MCLLLLPILSCFFSSRRRHTRCLSDWSSDVCSSDLYYRRVVPREAPARPEAEPACGPAAVGAAASDPLQLESTDRVRLEVSVSHGRELHSWPGARGRVG